MSRKYKKNPEYKGTTCLNGVVFDEDTVVAGDQWEQWTRPQFPGIPSVLIHAPQDTPVTKNTSAAPQEPPKAPEGRVALTSNKPDADKPGDQEEAKGTGTLSVVKRKPEPVPEKPVVDPAIHEGLEDDDDDGPEIQDIPGVGPGRARALEKAGYTTVEQVAGASATQMVKDVGARKMTVATARSVISKAKRLLDNQE